MRGRITYKGELGQFVDLKGGIGEKEEMVFLRVVVVGGGGGGGVDTPMHAIKN